MSKIRLYGETSGYVELQAPDVANDVTITLPNATGAFATEPYVDAAIAAIPGIGSNVVQTVKTDTFTTSSTTFVDVTGLTATITPTSNTSKILVLSMVSIGQTSTADHTGPILDVVRGSTPIFIGDADTRGPATFGINGQLNARLALSVNISAVDSPETNSPVTYGIRIRIPQVGGAAVVNRTGVDSGSDTRFPRMFSAITLIEVAP